SWKPTAATLRSLRPGLMFLSLNYTRPMRRRWKLRVNTAQVTVPSRQDRIIKRVATRSASEYMFATPPRTAPDSHIARIQFPVRRALRRIFRFGLYLTVRPSNAEA